MDIDTFIEIIKTHPACYFVSGIILGYFLRGFVSEFRNKRSQSSLPDSPPNFRDHPNEILSYDAMCTREGGTKLIAGINPNISPTHSVILMSRRHDAPYPDEIKDDSRTLIYSGQKQPRIQGGYREVILEGGRSFRTSYSSHSLEILLHYIGKQVILVISPKGFLHDIYLSNNKVVSTEYNDKVSGKVLDIKGNLTNNEKFNKLVNDYKQGISPPHAVRVYEKIEMGKWAYNGLFSLLDSWQESDRTIRFKLTLQVPANPQPSKSTLSWDRIIPGDVKRAVWNRDGGKCVKCGSDKNLHFDHIIPFSKGGTSLTEKNIQLLCMDCNYEKSDEV